MLSPVFRYYTARAQVPNYKLHLFRVLNGFTSFGSLWYRKRFQKSNLRETFFAGSNSYRNDLPEVPSKTAIHWPPMPPKQIQTAHCQRGDCTPCTPMYGYILYGYLRRSYAYIRRLVRVSYKCIFYPKVSKSTKRLPCGVIC